MNARPVTLSYIRNDYKETRIIRSCEAMMTAHQRHLYRGLQKDGLTKLEAIRKIGLEEKT